MLKIAERKRSFPLLVTLGKNKDFDFSVFKVKDENEFEKLSHEPRLAIMFKDEELLKDKKYRDIITDAVMTQNNFESIKLALAHGINIPLEYLESNGYLCRAFGEENEELFNALIEMGIDVTAQVSTGNYKYESSFSIILKSMEYTESTDFWIRALKKILESGIKNYSTPYFPFRLLFSIDDPRVIATVKESLKLTKKIIEDEYLLQLCIDNSNFAYFNWLLSFKPDIFKQVKDLNIPDFALSKKMRYFKKGVFHVTMLLRNEDHLRKFLDLLINEYDFTGKESIVDIYSCLMNANDIELFKKIKEHGLNFNNKHSISCLCNNYAYIDKAIVNFYFENGVSPKDLSREQILKSYVISWNQLHRMNKLYNRNKVEIRRKDIQEIMDYNMKEIRNAKEIINNLLQYGLYKFATILVQCGLKVKLNVNYMCSASPENSIYFTNVALENGCTFTTQDKNTVLFELLKNCRVKSFYILAKNGFRIKKSKYKISECIEYAKKCGIPEDFINSVVTDK